MMWKEALKDFIEIEKQLKIEHWVRIKLAIVDIHTREETVLKVWDMRKDMLEKYLWYIDWRRGYYIYKNPRKHVSTFYSHYDKTTGLDYGITSLLHKYVSAKAQITKVNNRINQYLEFRRNENDLFYNQNTDEKLIKARAKLKQKEENLRLIDIQLQELQRELQNKN